MLFYLISFQGISSTTILLISTQLFCFPYVEQLPEQLTCRISQGPTDPTKPCIFLSCNENMGFPTAK